MKLKLRSIIPIILALVLCLAITIPAAAADLTLANDQATALKHLGLFKGVSDTNFELDRAPTRTEALVMLVRALGEEAAALEGDWSHPFTDVAAWADPYVGYAYEKGLTKGYRLQNSAKAMPVLICISPLCSGLWAMTTLPVIFPGTRRTPCPLPSVFFPQGSIPPISSAPTSCWFHGRPLTPN